MRILPIIKNNVSKNNSFIQGQCKNVLSNKVLAYTTAGLIGLGLTSCGTDYSGLKNCDVFEHIDRKELLDAFSTDYLDNVKQISDTEYTARAAFNKTFQFGARGDVKADVYLKKDLENPNHIVGSVNLFEDKSYLVVVETTNVFGGKAYEHEKRWRRIPRTKFDFDAVMEKDKNSDNYKVKLKVLDKNGEYSEHILEKNKKGVFLDGETPFEEFHKAENLAMTAIGVFAMMMIACALLPLWGASRN